MILQRRCIQILLTVVLILGLGFMLPDIAQAGIDLKIHISDPDNPVSGSGEGNTVNSVLSTPTVSSGPNRELGTVRITGKPGIAVPVKAGQKIMVTLPVGTAYMKIANSTDIDKYVKCPEMLDGQKNQLISENGQPTIKLRAATPHSLTIEIAEVDSKAPIMALDFLFNQEDYSKIRVAPFIEKLEEYAAQSNENLSRLEFYRLLSQTIVRFAPTAANSDKTVLFKDTTGLDPADLDDVMVLVKAGWLQGSGGLLRPNEPISRVEAGAMLGRVFPAQGFRPMFTDIIPAWAGYDINSAFAAGIISGYADGSFQPNRLLSKGEAISLLQHSLEAYCNKQE